MNPIGKEVSERFYFSYSPEEVEELKQHNFYYLTKAIHPKSGLTFCMYDKSDKLIQVTQEFRRMRREQNVN